MKSKNQIVSYYSDTVSVLDKKIENFHKRINRLSVLRLTAFVAAIACIYLFGTIGLIYGIGSALLLIVLFFYLVLRYIELQEILNYNKNLRQVFHNEVSSLTNDGNIYSDGDNYSAPSHPYTDDLDIFGKASVFHFINRCITKTGNNILAGWLRGFQSRTLILQRQEAVIELKSHIEKTYWFRAYLLPHHQNELNDISHAIKHHFKKLLAFTDSKWLRIYALASPWLLVSLLLLVLFTSLSWKVFIPLLFLNYLINTRYTKNIQTLHELAGRSAKKIQVYAKVLKWLETTKWNSIYLQQLLSKCTINEDKEPGYKQAEKLSKLIELLDYRLNIIVSIVLNLGFLWDIRCAYKIRKWHEHAAGTIVNALEVIGEFEALISLSTLSYNHTDWIFPQLKEGFVFDAKAMGHPLIREEKRVNNDFNFAKEKKVDVITGSNMAGKSTFLRTVGVNMVLAFAGAPVCCKSLNLSPVRLVSYMRIKDSLNESTSTFKAEINRLKMILEKTAAENDSFALIDEMLRGTNSRDKFLGTKAFIEKLLQQNSAAIIATHDLQAARLAQQYPERIRNFHFDIQTEGQEMFFDYKIKDGECKTFNASILLKQIGLEIDNIPVRSQRPDRYEDEHYS